MKALKIILEFLLEVIKIQASIERSSQKDEPLSIETDGKRKKIIIPKSVIIAGFSFLTTVIICLVNLLK